MSEQFWHNLITDKSFAFLQQLQKKFKFVLIGGWAVYFYTKALKSKDIDIIVDFEELGRLRESFDLVKNERLRKYEIRAGGFDIDIYVPHWSELGLPPDFVMEKTVWREGFRLPPKEILLVFKLFVYSQRTASLKGKKDMIDIISLLFKDSISLPVFIQILKEHNIPNLKDELGDILKNTFEVKELGINQKQFSDFKKSLLAELEK